MIWRTPICAEFVCKSLKFDDASGELEDITLGVMYMPQPFRKQVNLKTTCFHRIEHVHICHGYPHVHLILLDKCWPQFVSVFQEQRDKNAEKEDENEKEN